MFSLGRAGRARAYRAREPTWVRRRRLLVRVLAELARPLACVVVGAWVLEMFGWT